MSHPSTPAITALMPVDEYHPRYLQQALESLRAQTRDQWRLLIITEARREAELRTEIAAVLADPRVGLIINRGRKLAGAFNTGMRTAQTEFVAILLSDDLWAPETVEVLSRACAEHPQVDFFHSSRRIIDEHGSPISSVYPSRADVQLEHFGSPSPVKHLLCWRRSLALSFGGMDETLNSVGPDDFDFPWSMAEHGAVFRALPECLYIYRDHRSSFRLTTHLPLSVHKREIRRIMRKHGADRAAIKRAVHNASESYLRQCVYRSKLDRWVWARLRLTPPSRRETYR